MKKLRITCGLVCILFSVSGFASAQKVLSIEESAKALSLFGITNNSTDIRLPQAPGRIEPGHELGNVTGTNIEMKVYDHAVAGAINGSVAWGFFNEAAGTSSLIMRKYGQTISAEFKRQPDKSIGGIITSGDASSQRTTSVFMAGADAANHTFTLRINEELVVVSITSEGMSNGHFVNPTYSATIGGKPVSYRIEAEGCLGYSIQMGMIILGAYAH